MSTTEERPLCYILHIKQFAIIQVSVPKGKCVSGHYLDVVLKKLKILSETTSSEFVYESLDGV